MHNNWFILALFSGILWTGGYCQTLRTIPPATGFIRTPDITEYGQFLRNISLSKDPVLHLFDGREARNQGGHFAMLDLDVGSRDLQQCADAVIRLRAEYLFATGQFDRIRFNFTSGDEASWMKYRDGYRPNIKGNEVSWSKSAAYDDSYTGFRRYLDLVFVYAGSYSLARDLPEVSESEVQPGDVIVQGGFPGHAVIVLDMAENDVGERIILIGQSYMPAQEIHVVKNLTDKELSPWYKLENLSDLRIPSWQFDKARVLRFP